MDPSRHVKCPTVFPFDGFSAEEDVVALRGALTSKGNDSLLINLLTKRSYEQRSELTQLYKDRFGRDLTQDLSSAFSSKALKVFVALLEPPNDLLARDVEKALSALRTDDEVVSEVFCTRSNEKITAVQSAYQHMYGKTLLSAVNSDHNLSTNYKELMDMLLSGSRDEVREPNSAKASKRAASIHTAVEEEWTTATKIFSRLLTHESFDQLSLIFEHYRLISGLSIEEVIKSTFSGDVQYAYLAIVRAAINKSQYYAETVEVALKKLRRDDGLLIRVFVTRSEVDLEAIKREYLRVFHKTLYNGIRTETNGAYREIMLGLLGGP